MKTLKSTHIGHRLDFRTSLPPGCRLLDPIELSASGGFDMDGGASDDETGIGDEYWLYPDEYEWFFQVEIEGEPYEQYAVTEEEYFAFLEFFYLDGSGTP